MASNGQFPPLFGMSKTGKKQIWKISVQKAGDAAIIKVVYGYEGGKMVENEKEVTVGKNLGKKNETTPYEQALLEAQSTWTKKKDSGYGETTENVHVPQVATDAALAEHKTLLPMLAHTYQKRQKDVVFPCYVQAKLDGVRCIFHNGKLTSRNGKPFVFMEHLEKELEPAKAAGLILDGELYSTTLTFQQFVGLVKKKTLTAAHKEQLKHVQLWVYDCVSSGTYEERKTLLETFFAEKGSAFAHIKLLPTFECEKRGDLKKWHDKFVEEGNEGLIIRNKKGLYKLNTRSADLQKFKEFEDAEYKVVGFTDGEGIEKGLVIWTCETEKGLKFNVRPRGTHEERAAIFKEAKKYVGQELTVRYQELTEDGIPRFPVGIAFRGYE